MQGRSRSKVSGILLREKVSVNWEGESWRSEWLSMDSLDYYLSPNIGSDDSSRTADKGERESSRLSPQRRARVDRRLRQIQEVSRMTGLKRLEENGFQTDHSVIQSDLRSMMSRFFLCHSVWPCWTLQKEVVKRRPGRQHVFNMYKRCWRVFEMWLRPFAC